MARQDRASGFAGNHAASQSEDRVDNVSRNLQPALGIDSRLSDRCVNTYPWDEEPFGLRPGYRSLASKTRKGAAVRSCPLLRSPVPGGWQGALVVWTTHLACPAYTVPGLVALAVITSPL